MIPHSTPVPISRIRIDDGFWSPRLETNRRATLPLVYERCRETGRIDALRLQWKPGDPNKPHVFWESDLAKWMEAASYSLQTSADPTLQSQLDEVITLLERAQQPDGYLNAYYTVVEPGKRWSNLRDKHELYCAGHLIEAAVAHHAATGETRFLQVMCRYADLMVTQFGSEDGKLRGYCGHPEIELALVKLYRATGEKRYLQLAQFFIDARGQQPHYFDEEARQRGEDPGAYWAKTHEYTQSHLPVRKQSRAVGHAVRAMYLYSGMVDVARETGDATLLESAKRLWRSVYLRQIYLTGGIGPCRQNEGFTFDYDLPNDSAYAETCASIASVFWNHRLLQIDCNAVYADEMERALYNAIPAGVSADGKTFFYVNPLEMHSEEIDPTDPYVKPQRVGWFGCACCPPNIARLFASFGQYIYSENEREAAVHLFVQSKADLRVAGRNVQIIQETEYPWKGQVRINVHPATPSDFGLKIRRPGWARDCELFLNGKPASAPIENGYFLLRRKWSKGDQVELRLPMPIERIHSHPAVRANSGKVALQRGPIVYCVESIDIGLPLSTLVVPKEHELKAVYEQQMFGGTTTLRGEVLHRTEENWEEKIYRPSAHELAPAHFKAVPYAVWGNRGATEMAVWLSES